MREEAADVVEDAHVGGGVGARCAADGRLVDLDDLVDVVDAFDGLVGQGGAERVVEVLGEDGLEGVVDEGGLAAAADAGDADEEAQGQVEVDRAEVVAGSPFQYDMLTALVGSAFGEGNVAAACEVVEG